ncbi:MAG: DUF6261 family protein [Prevotellaceae bacterium]|jgi:hypothetical protein|nr:DUF6261 family protein [Prevotellaceae bacterium]
MKKLLTIHFGSLPLAAHFNYVTKFVLLLASAGEAVQTAIAALLPTLNQWLEKEKKALQWVYKSALTEKIAEADRRLDHALAAINAGVKLALYSLDADTRAAASRLQIMLKEYGRVAHQSYDEESGNVRILIGQLTGLYAADVITVGLTDWVIELQAASAEFEALLRERETEQIERPELPAQTIRRNVDKAYHQIEDVLDAGSTLGASPDFGAFIDLMNPDIERTNAEFHKAKHNMAQAQPAPIPPQPHTGALVTPTPDVYYAIAGAEPVKLALGNDYNLTYKNNKEVGTAECTIHGKGQYTGSKTITFIIEAV